MNAVARILEWPIEPDDAYGLALWTAGDLAAPDGQLHPVHRRPLRRAGQHQRRPAPRRGRRVRGALRGVVVVRRGRVDGRAEGVHVLEQRHHQQRRVLAPAFDQDRARTFQRGLGIGHALVGIDDDRLDHRPAFEQALKRLEADCKDRPGVKRARQLQLVVDMQPVADDGELDSVNVTFRIKESIPKRESKAYNMQAVPGGLLFNDASPEDVRQMSLDMAPKPGAQVEVCCA